MKRRSMALILMLGLAAQFLTLAISASPIQEFKVDDAWGRDTVQFRTTAPLEDIVGTTNRVRGFLTADPTNLTSSSTQARIEVDLSSIKTGISLRDAHVAKALGADKAPTATFKLERVATTSSNALQPNVPVNLVGKGILELKGVRRQIDVALRVTYVPRGGPFSQSRPGNFIRFVAEFDVNLADFGIDRSSAVMQLQVGGTAHVTVTALASDATVSEAEQYRQTAIRYLGKANE